MAPAAIPCTIMADVTKPGGDRTKVLWLTKGLGPGGAERLLLSFAQNADHEVADKSQSIAADDLAGQKSSNDANDDPDQKSFKCHGD